MSNRESASGAWPAAARIVLYVLAVTAPLVLATILKPQTDHKFLRELANSVALVAYGVLVMQFVLTARSKWVERPFAHAKILAYHKAMGVLAGLLLLSHPLLLAGASGRWSLLTRFDQSWVILLGKIALVLLAVTVVTALFRQAIRLEYKKWLALHNVIALPVLVLGFVHSSRVGNDLAAWPMKVLWYVLLGLAVVAYAHNKIVRGRRDS